MNRRYHAVKYEVPCIEIVRFDFKNNILTASVTPGAGGEDHVPSNPMATEPDEYDPFA